MLKLDFTKLQCQDGDDGVESERKRCQDGDDGAESERKRTGKTTTASSSIARQIRIPLKDIPSPFRVNNQIAASIRPVDRYTERQKPELRHDLQLYTRDHLNAQQRRVFDHATRNLHDILLVQAGPGTGKTFTMLTIAYALRGVCPVNVIIYKHDLLFKFQHCAYTRTVTSFFMRMFDIKNLYDYNALETQLCLNMNNYEFCVCIEGLIRRARVPYDLVGGLMILDEYTVVPKPLLFVLLTVLQHHHIGIVVCGDKNQLQNIHNSKNTMNKSAYDIVTRFSTHVYEFNENKRCVNERYNEFVNFISRFSSNRRVDSYGYALLTSVLHRNMINLPQLTDIHLAANHRELADTVHIMVINEKIPVSFYYIDGVSCKSVDAIKGVKRSKTSSLYMPNVTLQYEATGRPGKFLPYIPLMLSATYFLNKHSEESLATLQKIRLVDGREITEQRDCVDVDEYGDLVPLQEHQIDLLVMEECRTGIVRRIRRESCNHVLFEQHRNYILRGGESDSGTYGSIFNFPIYPTNIMSIHMCQGRTISGPLDLLLTSTTYQGMYVAVSRVTDPRCITRLKIPNIKSHLLSVILNFEELCDAPDSILSVDTIQRVFKNYKLYEPNERGTDKHSEIAELIVKFITSTDPALRRATRALLMEHTKDMRFTILHTPDVEASDTVRFDNSEIMNILLDYENVLLALSRLDAKDAVVWIYEFVRADMRFRALRDNVKSYTFSNYELERYSTIRSVCDLSRLYVETDDGQSVNYIKRHAYTSSRDPIKPQHVIQHYETSNSVLETTRLRCAVYHELKRSGGEPLSVDLLMKLLTKELELIVSVAHTSAMLEPKKAVRGGGGGGNNKITGIGAQSIFKLKRKINSETDLIEIATKRRRDEK